MDHREAAPPGGPGAGQACRDRVGVDEHVCGQRESDGVDGLLPPAAEVAHVPLARDHDRRSGQARRGYPEDVAVEVEAVHDPHVEAPQVAGQPQDRARERRGPERARPDAPRLKAGGLEPRAQRALGADAADMKIPACAIEAAGDPGELPLGAPQVQGVSHEEYAGTPGSHTLGPSSRRTARFRTTSAHSRSQ